MSINQNYFGKFSDKVIHILTLGMSAFEIMLAHVLTQLIVMTVQVALLLVFALFVFKVSILT